MARFTDRGALAPSIGRETGCGTGPVRRRRPVYITRRAPCDHACPVGESVQRWLGLLQSGHLREAWDVLSQSTPFPAIHGRICRRACERSCTRADLDDVIQIRAAERFLGDLAIDEGWQFPDVEQATGKRAMVVGAGPAGLSAAYHLARRGHAVTVFESSSQAGGLMRYGIPAFELPRSVLDAEIARMERLGIRIELDHRVDRVLDEREAGGFDVAFLGLGAGESVPVDLTLAADTQVWDAVEMLRRVEEGAVWSPGQRVAVWGSGRLAVAAARVARRLGADDVTLVCRCKREQMSASDASVKDAEDEGIQLCCRTELREAEAGRVGLKDLADGGERTMPIDALVVALGRHPSGRLRQPVAGMLPGVGGTLGTDERMMSGHPGIYLGGDLVSEVHSVATAVGHGREAAFHMDLYLRETSWAPAPHPEVATYDFLNLWYVDSQPVVRQETLGPERRQASFEEVARGLTGEQAREEVGRCLSCGACMECDGCYASCPETAVVQLGPGRRYRFDYDLCTGCAICHDQCPTGAIAMIAEPHRHGATT